MSDPKLTHLDDQGQLAMVDISHKDDTKRTAIAQGVLLCSSSMQDAFFGGTLKKGDALAAARIAGILAAKNTHMLIPLCHQVPLSDVRVEFGRSARGVTISATAVTVGKTGVEMEAMVACATAGLTLYDMGKGVEREMVLTDVKLVFKAGGKSGTFDIRTSET